LPSELGKTIRAARLFKGLSLRELAKRIGKSPTYVVALEQARTFPGSADATLTAIARELGLSPDALFALLNRAPASLQPETVTELALHRLLKTLTDDEQHELLAELNFRFGARTGGEPADRLPGDLK
jgi:transcriptional regulator with XRE-family HTH domain